MPRPMARKPQAPYCSRCGKLESRCDEQAKATVCYRCTMIFADAAGKRAGPKRACPGCGGSLLPRARFCAKCRAKRRKSTNRAAVSSYRQKATQKALQTQGL